MATRSAGITGGMLAGAASATAMNAVSYLDQALRGITSTTSPAGEAVAQAAGQVVNTGR